MAHNSVDATKYPPGEAPHVHLRALFAQHTVNTKVRLLLANKIPNLTVAFIADLGDTHAEALAALETICGPGLWSTVPAEKSLEQVRMRTLITATKHMAGAQADQAAKYADDPHKIPQIPDNERILMRSQWVLLHKGMDLNEYNEPHGRFLDTMRRDWQVHGRVMLYELPQIRVRADKVVMRPAVHQNVDQLLQAVAQEMPGAHVENSDQLFDRLHAHFVAMEFLGLLTADQFVEITVNYVNLLRKFHREHGCQLAYAIRADSKFREMVDRDTTEDPRLDYPSALKAILEKKMYLWDSAVTSVETEKLQSKGTKRAAEDAGTSGNSPATPSKRAKKRANKAANAKLALTPPRSDRSGKQSSKGGGKGNGKSGGKSGGKGGGRPSGGSPKIPSAEMDALMELIRTGKNKRVCRFYNSSAGCSFGEGCNFTHECAMCGQAHRWCEVHKQ